MAEQENIIIKVTVDNEAATKNINDQTNAITDLTAANKAIQEENRKLSQNYAANAEEIKRNNTVVQENKQKITEANASRKQSITEIKSENSSLNSLRASLAKNVRERNNVNTATKEGKKRFKELTTEIKKQNDSLKQAEQAGGDFRRQVGDYGQALNGVVPGLSGATSGMQALTSGSLAFIATPIGAVIGALGLAIGALTAYFKGSEEGQNELLKITETLSAVWSVFMDIVRDLGEAIFDAFSNPKETLLELGNLIQNNIMKRFEAFGLVGKAVAKIFSGDLSEGLKELGNAAIQGLTGVEGAIDKVQTLSEDVGNFLDETTTKLDENLKRATSIAATQAALDKEERKLLVDRANLEVQIADLRLQAKDEENKTATERISFLREAQSIEDEIFERELVQAQRRLQIQREQNAQSDSTKEDKLEEAQLEADLIRLQEQRLRSQRKLETEIQTNIKKRDAESAKARADEDKREKARLESLAAQAEAEFELSQLKKTLAAEEITDAQAKADALAEIELAELEHTLQSLEAEKEARILNAEETGESVSAINAEYAARTEEVTAESNQNIAGLQEDAASETADIAEKEQGIQDAKNAAYVDGVDGALNVASELTKENAEAQKAIALTQAILNGYQAVSNALASAPPPANFALAAISGVAAAVQVANIANTEFANGGLIEKFAEGGMVYGNSHAQGGVKFAVGGRVNELEGGEAVINKKNTSLFKPVLSAINSYGGNGKKFAEGGITKSQDGGVASSSSISSVDSLLGSQQSLENSLSSMPTPVVSVVDINNTQNKVSVKESRASL